MKKNNTLIMWVIIGFLVLIIILILLYYNYGRTDTGEPDTRPATTEQPADMPESPQPSKSIDNNLPQPDTGEADTTAMHIGGDESGVDTLSIEYNIDTDTGQADVSTAAEAAFLHIPRTKSIFNTNPESMHSLPSSKVYYHTTRGKIESLVLSRADNEKVEQLITYDNEGNKLDNLEIGLTDSEGNRIKYAVIYQNKVSTYTLSLNKNNKAQETVTEYTITNDLHFIKGKTYTKIL